MGANPVDDAISRIRVLLSHERPRAGGDEYVARLLDGDGKEIAATGFSPSETTDHPDMPAELRNAGLPRYFTAMVPFSRLAKRLVIDRSGVRLIEVPISGRPPELRLDQLSAGRITEPTKVTWQARDPDGDDIEFDIHLRYPDGVRRTLAMGLTAGEFVVDPAATPGGSGLELEIAATDGFNTTTRAIAGIELPNHPPEIAILHPESGSPVQVGGFVTLRAMATDAETGMLRGESIRWTSSRAGFLGVGDSLLAQFTSQGEDLVTATARDRDGSEARGQVTVRVVAK